MKSKQEYIAVCKDENGKGAVIRAYENSLENFKSNIRGNGYKISYACRIENFAKVAYHYHIRQTFCKESDFENLYEPLPYYTNYYIIDSHGTTEPIFEEDSTAEPEHETTEEILKAFQSDTFTDYCGNIRTVPTELLERFEWLVEKIKDILHCDTPIINGDLDRLPENQKHCVNGVNFAKELIIIDNLFLNMMQFGKEFEKDVILTICHEIAHNTHWNHGKKHTQLTEEYFNQVMAVLFAPQTEGQRIGESYIDYIKRAFPEFYQGLESLAEAGANLNPSPIVEDVGIDCLATDYAKLDEVCSGFKELLRSKCIPKRVRPPPKYHRLRISKCD